VAGIALDRIDFEIIRLLQNDGRMANKVLARAVGLAPSSCLARALGDALEAIIAVRLERHHRDDIDAFVEFALGLPETVAVTHVAGPTDILVHVAVADSDRLRDLVMDSFTTRPEVARFETSLVYSHQTGRR
jgi:DNA-binding Lrp family transcriptional regulator